MWFNCAIDQSYDIHNYGTENKYCNTNTKAVTHYEVTLVFQGPHASSAGKFAIANVSSWG